jgi:tetratricopeptide (TPR) repeat protein
MKSTLKIISKIILPAILLVFSIQANAQNETKMVGAFEKSYQFEQYKEYEKGIDALTAVYDANNYEINLRLGWLCYSQKDYTKSINYYKKAISIAPNSVEARLGYVYPASAMENWTEVKAQYEAILRIDPKNSTANYRLGYINYLNNDFKKAKEYLQLVYSMYPFDYDTVILLGWTNLKLGNTEDAKKLFYTALCYKPTDSSALEGLKLLK